MPNCLVTGGAGFIGSNLALALESLGHAVTVADRHLATKDATLQGFNGRLVEMDVTVPQRWDTRFDYVFHQAALTDPRHENDQEILQKNQAGFRHMVQLCETTGARLIYASTAGLYGNGPVPMHEDQPKEIVTAYAESKWRADQDATQFFAKLPIIGLRYFNVFGPRETHKGRPASMILHLARQMQAGQRPRLFKYGEHRRDFIYVKDCVTANLRAMSAPSGIYNVGTGVGTSFKDLAHILNRVLGTQLEPEYFDMPYDAKTYQHHTIADTTRAEKVLGFKAEWDLEAAIRDYLAWLVI